MNHTIRTCRNLYPTLLIVLSILNSRNPSVSISACEAVPDKLKGVDHERKEPT